MEDWGIHTNSNPPPPVIASEAKPFGPELTAEGQPDSRRESSWGRRRRIKRFFRATRRSLALLGTAALDCHGAPRLAM